MVLSCYSYIRHRLRLMAHTIRSRKKNANANETIVKATEKRKVKLKKRHARKRASNKTPIMPVDVHR